MRRSRESSIRDGERDTTRAPRGRSKRERSTSKSACPGFASEISSGYSRRSGSKLRSADREPSSRRTFDVGALVDDDEILEDALQHDRNVDPRSTLSTNRAPPPEKHRDDDCRSL
jgi:hypothetical protein